MALLAGALRQHHLYRPTQDPTGQQRQLLQQLADAALALAQAGDAAAAAAAALGVLRGILAVEHRVIQQQLPLLWPLLLHSPAAAGSGADGGVAAAVACSLVGTFGELRQLETLLQSLIDALLVPASGEAPAPADAAAAVLGSGQFRAALAAAVGQVPSGQVPVVLRLVAAALPRLSQGSGGSQLLAADLCYHCLASLQVDLVTAAAAATAAAALVAALAPQLLPLLGAAASSSSKAKKQKAAQQQDQALLPALLRLYRQALLLHARCAALHPEVRLGHRSDACWGAATALVCSAVSLAWLRIQPLPLLLHRWRHCPGSTRSLCQAAAAAATLRRCWTAATAVLSLRCRRCCRPQQRQAVAMPSWR